jgi:hypothetical protein
MFIAAVLDAFPRFEHRVIGAIDALDAAYPVSCSLVAHTGNGLPGHRFEIEPFVKYFGRIPLAFPQEPARWDSVRKRLNAAQIGGRVRTHAIEIFELMVRAGEAAQNTLPERVVFEAGAWNSLAQVVGAATLIEVLEGARWSVSGSPADGAVSRIGGAIVEHLCLPQWRGPLPKSRALVRSGAGFGSPSIPDSCARLLYFEADETTPFERDATPPQTRSAGRPDQRSRQ